MSVRSARARVEDVHELAMAMPHVTVEPGSRGNPVYQVGGKSFGFFRNPRADATDPETGERYADVIVFWVGSESDKLAMIQDRASPFFTTAHFDGHPSVLLRSSRIGELARDELAEMVQDAWLAQVSERRRTLPGLPRRRSGSGSMTGTSAMALATLGLGPAHTDTTPGHVGHKVLRSRHSR